jgi:hypothetical protein
MAGKHLRAHCLQNRTGDSITGKRQNATECRLTAIMLSTSLEAVSAIGQALLNTFVERREMF